MGQKFFGDNKSLIYLGFFSIILTYISNFIGILGFIVPIVIACATVFIIVNLPYRTCIIYGILIAVGTWFSFNNIIDALFFLATIAAISVPIALGLKKKYEFKTFMVQAVISLCFVLVVSLIYSTLLSGMAITLDSIIDTFLKPTYEMAEIFKQNSDIATLSGINIDETIGMFRNMSIGIVVSIAIIQTFVTYLFCVLINKYLVIIKEDMMHPLYYFKISKIGGILYVIATLVTFFSSEGDTYLVALNFYIIMQFPMALCGLCAIYKLMGMYKLKQKTKKLLITLIIIFMIIPVFNLLGSVAFIGGMNCILDVSDINKKSSI